MKRPWLTFFLLPTASCYYIIKTNESFKLSDLIYMQFRQCGATRLAFDETTGSSILQCERYPSYPCDWIATMENEAGSLAALCRQNIHLDEPWILKYLSLPRKGKSGQYTANMAKCAVAQQITGSRASIDKSSAVELLILDLEDCCVLCRLEGSSHQSETSSTFWKKWSKRPFQYSSAIDPNIAIIAMAFLEERLSVDARIFDPCCGSGTFLAVSEDFKVTGWDVNPKCVEGARKNLSYMGRENYEILHGDSCGSSGATGDQQFDGLVSNLPWGINTKTPEDDTNLRIIKGSRPHLKTGAPCIWVDRQKLLPEQWEELGYRVLDSASVPPSGFILPKDKKNRIPPKGDRNHCIVTLVEAI